MMIREDRRYEDYEATLASYLYRGRSVGSMVTYHQFPGHDFMFDVGAATLSTNTIRDVFITHGHADHIEGLAGHHLRRHGTNMQLGRYYVFEEDVELVRDVVRAQARLNRSPRLSDVAVIPVGRGSEFSVGKAGIKVRPFRGSHTVPTLGYGAWLARKRLLPEFVGVDQAGIVAAKKAGKVVDQMVERCEIAFPGDTNARIYERPGGDLIRQARLLLLECTFLNEEVSAKEADGGGHIHIEDILRLGREGAFDGNEVVLLTHFSARYTASYIRQRVAEVLGNEAFYGKIQLCLP